MSDERRWGDRDRAWDDRDRYDYERRRQGERTYGRSDRDYGSDDRDQGRRYGFGPNDERPGGSSRGAPSYGGSDWANRGPRDDDQRYVGWWYVRTSDYDYPRDYRGARESRGYGPDYGATADYRSDYRPGEGSAYGSPYGREPARERGYGYGGERGERRDARGYGGRGDDRNWFDKAGDEVSSWFGDQDAYRRREEDRIRQGEHRGRGPSGYRRSDERIREDVSDRLADDSWLDASEIQVQVKDGEVTLIGVVHDRNDKRHAEDLAERVSGVAHVQNNLRTKATSGVMHTAGSNRDLGTGRDTSGTMSSTGSTSTTTGAGSTASKETI
jgi:osmotically-inducible protein OsmY